MLDGPPRTSGAQRAILTDLAASLPAYHTSFTLLHSYLFLRLNAFLAVVGRGQSIFQSLLGLHDFRLKVICLSQWHILEWPALGPYPPMGKPTVGHVLAP